MFKHLKHELTFKALFVYLRKTGQDLSDGRETRYTHAHTKTVGL